tara:strand:+ start:6102 stop:6383 length:282 start_codon:yes stop_codon:yes gene_type:complete
MNKIESIKEITDDELTYLGCSPEEYEDAIIGIAHRFGAEPIVAYDYDKVLESLAERFKEAGSEDPHMDALEFFNHNIIGSWVGDKTPIFIQTL